MEEIVPLLAAFKPKSPNKMGEVWDLSEKTAKSIRGNEILFTQLAGKCRDACGPQVTQLH